jgi:hypothetical protein
MVARDRLRVPVITDSVLLLCLMAPMLVAAAVLGASVEVLIVIHAAAHVALTGTYLLLRYRLGGVTGGKRDLTQ